MLIRALLLYGAIFLVSSVVLEKGEELFKYGTFLGFIFGWIVWISGALF